MSIRERVRRAIDANPFDPVADPEMYRRWDAARSVCEGTASTVHVAATISGGWRNHAALEGIEYE